MTSPDDEAGLSVGGPGPPGPIADYGAEKNGIEAPPLRTFCKGNIKIIFAFNLFMLVRLLCFQTNMVKIGLPAFVVCILRRSSFMFF